MSDICVSWQRDKYCYAHEQCRLATKQWSRLLDSMLSVGLVKAAPLCGPSIDPCLTRLVNNADYESVTLRESGRIADNGCSDCELLPCKHCCSDGENGTRHCLRRNGLTPWKSDVRIYSSGVKGLNEEIEDFYSYMCPLPEERLMRQKVIERVSGLVTELWPSAKVDVFGSFATGLYLPTSDIDLVIQWDMDAQSQPEMMQNALITLEKQLINKGIYADIKVIRTSVPIVKFTDCETAIKVDVGFSASISTGIQSVHFIKEQMHEYPLIRCLVVVLKQFLIYHNLLESFNGGISSYCLILLILSYLQMNGDEDYDNSNTGHHLIRFLELYGCQFNYLHTGIRIRDGGSYFRKNEGQAGEFENRYQYSLLCIEDPLNSANDVGQGCYGAMKVRDAFANAYRELRDAVLPQYQHIQSNCSSFLGRILLIPVEVVKYRHVIRSRWQLRPSSSSSTSSSSANEEPDHLPAAAAVGGASLTQLADDRSDSGSCSSRTSNLSSLTKSSGICQSQSPGSIAALSDADSDGVLSDTANKKSSWRAPVTTVNCTSSSFVTSSTVNAQSLVKQQQPQRHQHTVASRSAARRHAQSASHTVNPPSHTTSLASHTTTIPASHTGATLPSHTTSTPVSHTTSSDSHASDNHALHTTTTGLTSHTAVSFTLHTSATSLGASHNSVSYTSDTTTSPASHTSSLASLKAVETAAAPAVDCLTFGIATTTSSTAVTATTSRPRHHQPVGTTTVTTGSCRLIATTTTSSSSARRHRHMYSDERRTRHNNNNGAATNTVASSCSSTTSSSGGGAAVSMSSSSSLR